MARATLEMFLKLTGADKTSKGLDKVSNSSKKLDSNVKNSSKSNAQFAAGMSGLGKAAVAGASIFAARALADFARDSVMAASSAQEAAGAFGTTFGNAAANLTKELEKNANLFGLTTSEAQQLIGVFGAVAQGMGFTQSESADLSSRLFALSGDIASFNNISAGAEPVLRAFQSAIVGEREALKTYGIAISEAEVQTKAFEMTGKTSADALTRQEKALATTELLFDKASVQIGNAEREAEGFAAQMLQTRAKTQQFREELGEQLLPAASNLLGFFNNFIDSVAPAVVGAFEIINDGASKFGELNNQIFEDATNAFENYTDTVASGTPEILTYLGYLLSGQMAYYNKNKDKLDEVTEEVNKYTDAIEENSDVANKNSVTIFSATGYSQNFFDVLALGNKAYEKVNKQFQKNRMLIKILSPEYKKFGAVIDKDVLPFAEKLAGVLGISNQEIKDLTALQKDRDETQKDLNRALEEEGLLTAQEALRKKELQQQIAELTFFQGQGKDVTEELAVAQEELKLVELALTRESDQLTEARKRATEAQETLEEATGEGTTAAEKQLDAVNNLQEVMDLFDTENFRDELILAADKLNFDWKTALDGALSAYVTFRQQVTGKSITTEVDEFLKALDEQGLLFGGFTPSPLADPVETPADTLGDNSNLKSDKNGGGDTNVNLTFELDGDALQQYNIKLQQQGKTFQIR
jgi:hypothetical protein